MNWFQSQSVVLQAFLAGLFTWGCTIVGSAIVFFFKHISRKLLDIMMGFAAGVMIAASFWSLLQPSIEYAETSYGSLAWLPAAIGFLAGGFFLRLIDAIVPHLHMTKEIEEAVSIRRGRRSCLKRLYSFSPLPSTISQKAWRSEWPLELWLAIQVQKPLSGRLVWPSGLACKISQKGQPFLFRFERMENPVSMPFIGDLCQPSSSPSELC